MKKLKDIVSSKLGATPMFGPIIFGIIIALVGLIYGIVKLFA